MAIRMAHTLMEQKIQARAERVAEGNKRKWENTQGENMNNNHNNCRDNNHQYQQHNQSKGNARAMTSTQNGNADQAGPAPKCHCCGVYHFSRCPIKCNKCGKFGHKAKDYKGKAVATVANTQPILVCYKCGEMGHARNRCPKRNNQPSGNAHSQAYVIKDTEQNQGPNVVTGTFLVNNRYATVLFDSEADKSFVNTSFSHLIDINPVRLYTSYEVELADGKIVSTNTVLRGCTLDLVNHLFEIDLMPIELGTFNVIIRMDWLVKRDAVIVYVKKVVHIPVKNKTLVVEGDIVIEKEPAERSLKDLPIIRDFPEVFPDDLPGLPPPRQVEFRIELVPEAAPVARASYRLAPSKMKELADQLQELSEKGFIRPSSSP
ncbi:putative reverse transcriptase domain-containing protein [Tanacetum coccineum]